MTETKNNETSKMYKLGRNIAAARKAKGMSQNAFSELIGISREHLAKIETAKRGISIQLLFKVADELEIKESDLMSF